MIVRIAHTSDNHWREEALDECVRVHRAFVEQALAEKVHVVLLGGDFFERRSTPAERNACADWLRSMAEAGLYVFGVAGNHDSPGDLELFNDVLGPRGKILDRDLKTASPALIDTLSGLAIIGLPWIERTQYATQGVTVRSVMDAAAELARAQRTQAGRVPLLVAHVEIEGYATPAGVMPAGSTHAIAPDDPGFAPFAYVACGHIHGHQSWAGGRIAYCGSPTRSNYGEAAEEKGWVLVEVDDERPEGPIATRFVPLPARRMHTLDYVPDIVPEGDAVRVRLACTAEEAAATDVAEIERKLREAGAAEVRVEIVVAADARVRSEEITAAESTWEQVLAFFRAKGGVPDEARLARLRAELGRCEQEVDRV